MNYYLMHKNIEVVSMDIDESYDIHKVKINNKAKEHVPVGGQLNAMRFHEWWHDRATPSTRDNANSALKALGLASTTEMLVKNLALSLTDCYWIKPFNTDLKWEQVSLFRNNFIDAFGELNFNSNKQFNNLTIFGESQGNVQKKWVVTSDNKRALIKGNSIDSYQQSLNEILATEIHKRQCFKEYTPYSITKLEQNNIACLSYNFCNEQVEFISAWELLQSSKIKSADSWFNKFRELCIHKCKFSEQYVDTFLSYEIMTDFLMSNTDRHMNNIGVLRNPDTLEFISFAPIYDTGNSMFYNEKYIPTGNLLDIKVCSFLKYETKLLQYVKDRSIVDLSKLPTNDELYTLYSKDKKHRHCRIEQTIKNWNSKISYISAFQNGANIWKSKYSN